MLMPNFQLRKLRFWDLDSPRFRDVLGGVSRVGHRTRIAESGISAGALASILMGFPIHRIVGPVFVGT